jgi:O-antigen ligase
MSHSSNTAGRWDQRVLEFLLLAYALLAPISIALSEPLVYAAGPIWLYGTIRRKDAGVFRSPYFLPVALFALLAFASSLWALHPDVTLSKCHRLPLLLLVFVVGTVFGPDRAGGWESAGRSVILFVAGTTLRALYDVGRVSVELAYGVPLFSTGNMRDPQMYLTALCLLLALLLYPPRPGLVRSAALALAANAVGLVLHLKRGAWFAFGSAAAIMALAARRWKALGGIVVCAAALLLIPQIRERLVSLRDESSVRLGGRYVLWARVTPAILKDHPQGVGWAGVQYEDLQGYSRRVQLRLNHVHSNPLQVAVELGWLGLALWLWWMGTALWVMGTACRRTLRKRDDTAWLALGVFGAFCGLMFNGLVEYNFGDSEILMLLCFLMGLSLVVRARQRTTESAPAS